MAESKKVTGVTSAIVNLKSGAQVTVRHGETLPPNVEAGEVKRLEGLGVFGDTPRHLLPPAARAAAVATAAATAAGPDADALRARITELEAQVAAGGGGDQAARVAELEAQLAAAPAAVVPDGWLTAAQLSDMKVEEVTDYLEAHPEQREYVVALERVGDARKGITGD